MLGQLNFYIFSIVISFIFASTSVYSITCPNYKYQCGSYPHDWCCFYYESCGTYYSPCSSPTTTTNRPTTTPSDNFPSSILAILIIFPVSSMFIIVCAGIISRRHQQRIHSSGVVLNNQRSVHPYRQYPLRESLRTNHDRSVYSVSGGARTLHSIYEEAPPPYEVATADRPPKYECAPVTAMIEQTNTSV